MLPCHPKPGEPNHHELGGIVAPIHHDARRECNTAPLRPIASVYDEFMAG